MRTPPPRRREKPTTLGKLRLMAAEEGARQRRDERPFDPEAPREHYAKPHHFAVNGTRTDDEEVRENIVSAMARTFFVSAWANAEEEAGRTYPGEDLMDVAPSTPTEAYVFAWERAQKFEERRDVDLVELYELLCEVPGKHTRKPTDADFGYSIAQMMMGAGVSWWDDHPEPPEGDVLNMSGLETHGAESELWDGADESDDDE